MTKTGASGAWLAEDVPSHAPTTFVEAWGDLMANPRWEAWVSEHVDRDKPFFVMYFEDRDKPRIVIRGNDASYYVPAHTLATMPKQLRVQYHELYYQLYKRWAEKKGLPPPPEA